MDITNIANPANPEALILETKHIAIDGVKDEQGLRAIEKALRDKPGVREVRVDRGRSIASVTFDTRETNFPDIHDLILESGYRPPRSLPE